MESPMKRISLCVCLAAFAGWNGMARADGLNSENYSPAVDNTSANLLETPRTVGSRNFMLGYIFDYAMHPVEFGDGKSAREGVSDALAMSHFTVGYGLLNWLDLGIDLPFALYSAPRDMGGYLQTVGGSRKSFVLADPYFRAKVGYGGRASNRFGVALAAGVAAPLGNRLAMLSDNTSKIVIDAPLTFSWGGQSSEFYLTPGFDLWGDSERVVVRDPTTTQKAVLLQRQKALRVATGLRHWLRGNVDAKAGLQLELGGRASLEGMKMSLHRAESPAEWSLGFLYKKSSTLSYYGHAGTGIGIGVGAPLLRLAAGVRYVSEPPPIVEVEDESNLAESYLTSEAYSDRDLAKILEQAQQEPVVGQVSEDDSQLKLYIGDEIMDVGTVRFEFNSDRLTGQAKKSIVLLFEHLRSLNPASVKVDGHTDSVGSFAYNVALSKRRAESVKRELVTLGMRSSTIRTEGYAYKYPLESNGSKQGRAMNRRIEVSINDMEIQRRYRTQEELNGMIAPGGRKPTADSDVRSR